MPGGPISAERHILRALPVIGIGDAVVLLVRDRFDLLRFGLRVEVRVLLLDLLNLLGVGFSLGGTPLIVSALNGRVFVSLGFRGG